MEGGGKERRLTELMKAFKHNPEVEFELITMSQDIHYKEVFNLGIKIHYILKKTKNDLSIFKKIYTLFKEIKPDIVHCWDSMTGIYIIPSCKLLNIKLVNGMVVDTPKRNFFNRFWLRAWMIIPFSDVVIGNSIAGLNAYGAKGKKAICIYNGMDLNRFKNLKKTAEMRHEILGPAVGAFVIGMVAAFEDRKDYATLIKAAISLTSLNKDLQFIFVGNGDTLNNLKNQVPRELASQITFLGRRSDVESIVNIFDIGVLLTNTNIHGEGVSNSIIEYMALEKPVIATRGGGTNEVVIDNYNGFLIDPFNENQLIEKIKLMMGNAELRKKFGENGIKMVREKFNVQYMAEQYLNTYKKLLGKD